MATVCASCREPLTLEVDYSSDEDEGMRMDEDNAGPSSNTKIETVPDDVHLLVCNCHFHWQCLLDAYSHDSCPWCGASIISQSGNQLQILVDLNNEGGLQEKLDILPLLTEESYLKAYPEERRARAFLEFCRAGDLEAIVEMLQDADDDEEDDEDDDDLINDDEEDDEARQDEAPDPTRIRKLDILRYQDPIGEMQSGLHAAVEGKSREVAWLLLLVASKMELTEFPAAVFQEAAALGIMRDDEEVARKGDIRGFRDAKGRSAEDIARGIGGVWGDWIGKGWLVL